MLLWKEEIVAFYVFHEMTGDYVLHDLASYAGKTDGAIVLRFTSVSLFKYRGDVGEFPVVGHRAKLQGLVENVTEWASNNISSLL